MKIILPDTRGRPWKNLHFMIIGAADILQGSVTLMTLGFWMPRCHLTYLGWHMRRVIDRMTKEENDLNKTS